VIRPAPPSIRAARTTRTTGSEMNRPKKIEETAALVNGAGGRGIAVQVDHLVPACYLGGASSEVGYHAAFDGA
jgi:hypothetical protein